MGAEGMTLSKNVKFSFEDLSKEKGAVLPPVILGEEQVGSVAVKLDQQEFTAKQKK